MAKKKLFEFVYLDILLLMHENDYHLLLIWLNCFLCEINTCKGEREREREKDEIP